MRNTDFSKNIYNRMMEKSRELRPIQLEFKGHEMHHIIPKCMNGIDHVDNLVWLTKHEHMVAHYLLWRINRDARNAASFYLTLTSNTHVGCYKISDYHKKTCRKALEKTNVCYILNNNAKMLKILTVDEKREKTLALISLMRSKVQ